MKQISFCTICLCLLLSGPEQSQTQPAENTGENDPPLDLAPGDEPKVVTKFEKKIWNVTASLYKGAIKTEDENIIFSPLSLTSSMVMLNSGAGGETAREIRNLFKFETNSDLAVQNQTKILNSLKNQTTDEASGVAFLTASRIFANKENVNLLSNYVRAVSPLGDVETLDFSEPEQIVARMNEWVNNKTQGKISKIGGDKDFDKETAIVLLNTLYFKAPWKFPFNQIDTKVADFHVNDNKKVQVDTMYLSTKLPYVDLQEVETSAVFLPYKGDRFSMVIYLPFVGKKLSIVEEKLETLVPTEVRNEATTTAVSLYLPKFNISSSLDFKEILTPLGVESMFNRTLADFSKMTESPEFHVSKLLQQVFIEVNEEGAEAAALTEGHGLAATSAPNTVRVNRPFIFQIFDNITGTILLSGRVTNPNGKHVGERSTPQPTTAPSTTPKSTTPQSTTPESTTPQSTTPQSTTPHSTSPSPISPKPTSPKPTVKSGTSGANRMNIFLTPFFASLKNYMNPILTMWVVWFGQKLLLCYS